MKCVAIIVLYNPDLNRLYENVNAIYKQVDEVLMLDNGSDDTKAIDDFISNNEFKNVRVEHFYENKGIAYALRIGTEWASDIGAEWVLSLDQDSVSDSELVKNYIKYIDIENLGALTCVVDDRNADKTTYDTNETNEPIDVDICLTSGFFMSVKAYNNTDGYTDRMFIDKVDFDICLSLKDAGYRIVRIPYIGLLHELGRITIGRLLGKDVMVTNHPAWRQYYMARNGVILYKRHPKRYTLKQCLVTEFKELFFSVCLEKNKISKFWMRIKGFCAGLVYKLDAEG